MSFGLLGGQPRGWPPFSLGPLAMLNHLRLETYRALAVLKHEPPADQLALWSGAHSRKARSDYVAEMMEEVRRLIIGEGRPLTRSELVRRLEAEGFVIAGGDKRKVLGTNIWRSNKFDHVEGQGYWPKGVPRPR